MISTSPTVAAATAYEMLAAGNCPDGLRITGVLDYSQKSARPLPAAWPERLHVDFLDLSDREIVALPAGLHAYELCLAGTPVVALPDDLRVDVRLDLSRCYLLERLPPRLTVGTLGLAGCHALRELPAELDVWFLDLSGCWAFEAWPQSIKIRSGRLLLRGCTALTHLPPSLRRIAALNVRECPNLASLPPELVVTGALELAHSGLKEEASLPAGLARTQLRWAGVNVDRRIAFHPESITVDEVLAETNAERRRVLLERYGYGRFLHDVGAEILDRDTDPGGERQLLRVKLPDDEDLVAMSCFCPSTARQYMIRVPPTTPSCRHAAAWIAGFDDPDDYHPLQET